VDRRADVWAVGATLYQIFAGRPPYTGKNDLDVVRRIAQGRPVAKLPPTVPSAVADAIMTALQPDLSQRVSSAQEFQRILESVMAYPISPEDVARACRHYMKARMQARRAAIADALRDAAARAAGPGRQPAPPQQDLMPMRPTFPTLPPEAMPVVSQSVLLSAEHSTAFLEPDRPSDESGSPALLTETAGAEERVVTRLRPVHAVLVGLATLVTLGVWSTVVMVALQSGSKGALAPAHAASRSEVTAGPGEAHDPR
jgi:hypothetical protein